MAGEVSQEWLVKFIRGVAGEICQRTGWGLLFTITYLLCNFLPVLFSMCMYLVITVFFTYMYIKLFYRMQTSSIQ